FLAERVVPQIVGDTADAAGFLFDALQRFRFSRIHGERFFAEDVFTGAEQGAGLFEMDVIRRADVDASDVLISGELGEIRIGFFEPKGFCGGAATFGGAQHPSAYRNIEAAKRLEMSAADKAETDDGDGMGHERGSRLKRC